MSRDRSGEGYKKMYAALKVPKNTVVSILKWKKCRTAKTLPRARALVREVTKNPVTELQFLCGDNPLCSTPPIRPLW